MMEVELVEKLVSTTISNKQIAQRLGLKLFRLNELIQNTPYIEDDILTKREGQTFAKAPDLRRRKTKEAIGAAKPRTKQSTTTQDANQKKKLNLKVDKKKIRKQDATKKEKSAMARTGLTIRQYRSISELMIDEDPYKAFVRAGYSPKIAHSAYKKSITNPEYTKELERVRAMKVKRNDLQADSLLRELNLLMDSDITNYIRWDKNGKVRFVDSEGLTKIQRNSISEIQVSKDGKMKIKLYDRVKLIELLMKHFGMFTENIVHSIKNSTPGAPEDVEMDYSKLSPKELALLEKTMLKAQVKKDDEIEAEFTEITD